MGKETEILISLFVHSSVPPSCPSILAWSKIRFGRTGLVAIVPCVADGAPQHRGGCMRVVELDFRQFFLNHRNGLVKESESRYPAVPF